MKRTTRVNPLLIGISLLVVLALLLGMKGQTLAAQASENVENLPTNVVLSPMFHLVFSPFYKETSTLRLSNPTSVSANVYVSFSGTNPPLYLRLNPGEQVSLVGSMYPQLPDGGVFVVDVFSDQPITGELIQAPPETAQEKINSLIGQVQELVANGTLNAGQGNSLIVKLKGAITKLDADQSNVAVNLLHAFINQVTSLIEEGVLTMIQGQPLIDKATDIISMIES